MLRSAFRACRSGLGKLEPPHIRLVGMPRMEVHRNARLTPLAVRGGFSVGSRDATDNGCGGTRLRRLRQNRYVPSQELQ